MSRGTGVVLTKDGYIVTCNHVLAGCGTVKVGQQEKTLNAKIVGTDPYNDIALLKAEIGEFTPEAIRLLLNYPWPGNVRELENTIEHAAVLAKGKKIEPSDLPPAVIQARGPLSGATRLANIVEHEIRLLEETLEECGWNKKLAAERLGISRTTLYTKLKKYQIQRPTSH